MPRDNACMATRAMAPVRWYRSFYWRIGFSFFVLVIAVLVAQSAVVTYLMRRGPFMGRSPNNIAAIIAADFGSVLAQDPSLDLNEYLIRGTGGWRPPSAGWRAGRDHRNPRRRRRPECHGLAAGAMEGTSLGR